MATSAVALTGVEPVPVAYETTALPLSYRAKNWEKWRGESNSPISLRAGDCCHPSRLPYLLGHSGLESNHLPACAGRPLPLCCCLLEMTPRGELLETAVSRVLFPSVSSPAPPKVTTIYLSLLPDIHRTTPLGCLLAVAALPTLLLRLCFAVRTILRSPAGIGGAARTFLDHQLLRAEGP